MPFHCPTTCQPEPLSFLSKETGFYIDVTEVPPQDASAALRNRCAALQSDVDVSWDVDGLIAESGLHHLSGCGRGRTDFFKY